MPILEPAVVTIAAETPTASNNVSTSIGRNTLFGIISSVVQVATRVIIVPITISHLGLGGYGIWSIILVTATYMRFGSIGIKSAFQKYVAEATCTKDFHRTNKLLSTGTAAMLVISVVLLVPVAALATRIARASGVPPEFLSSAGWAISMLAIVMVFSNAGAAYEGIVMGGHRIDLTRKFLTILSVIEAVALVAVLRMGYGLFMMSVVIAASEGCFVVCCYFASRRVMPQIHVSRKYITREVGPELLRFAGSYQLVSVLQLIYGSVAPIAILRVYGANTAGVLAIANRLVSPVMMCQYAFLLPVLSGSAMIFASGSSERMNNLLVKSFKVTLGLTLIPLALISAFGKFAIAAWIGRADDSFHLALYLVSLSTLFQAFSVLGLVLYRASGKAVLDNIREVLRILALIPVIIFARELGFYGVLAGMAAAELAGMLFMIFSLTKTYQVFDVPAFLREALKVAVATIFLLGVGYLASFVSTPLVTGFRAVAFLKFCAIVSAILVSGYPILYLTGALSIAERSAILAVFKKAVPADASSEIPESQAL